MCGGTITAMLGLLVTLAISICAMGIGRFLVSRWTEGFDPAANLGTWGLVGLGFLGLVTLPIGLIPGGLHWGLWVIVAFAVGGAYELYREFSVNRPKVALPKELALLFPIAIGAALVMALVGVLAPSDSLDWDTLAYHLAVPKLWLQSGQIHYVSYIHHSNFPWTIDDLYIWGLTWGDQYGAKAFSWSYLALGLLTIFGLTRSRYGERAAWWATLAFATIPAVIWISGSAYIDVSNGLYAGLGILFTAMLIEEPASTRFAWLAAVFLGFAAGSKFTGLQTIAAAGAMVFVFGLRSTRQVSFKNALIVASVAMAIAIPWYIKTTVYTGNPVFPFFYSIFGGKNWASFNAMVYTREQKSFGVGIWPGADLSQVGHAILGLAYQPGRYANPGQTQGGGFPFAALGVSGMCAGLAWCFSGRMRRFEAATLATVGVGFLFWFLLSQQSRYIIAQLVPLSVLAGAAATQFRTKHLFAAIIGAQAAYSLYLVNGTVTSSKVQAVFGKVSPEEYQAQRVPFYEAAKLINTVAKGGRVALYDEVFGFFLDVPYMWANPGHSTELGYAEMQTADDLVKSLSSHGVTHVYLNFSLYPPSDPDFQRWVGAMGMGGSKATPYEGQDRTQRMTDLDLKWKVLMADAIATGKLQPMQTFTRGKRVTGLLLRVLPPESKP